MTQERGHLAYAQCQPNPLIKDAAPAIAALGPPIATFADRPVAELTIPATVSQSVRTVVATAVDSFFRELDRWRQ